jgi:hypothetical protein
MSGNILIRLVKDSNKELQEYPATLVHSLDKRDQDFEHML